jgi:hypothetical protein
MPNSTGIPEKMFKINGSLMRDRNKVIMATVTFERTI